MLDHEKIRQRVSARFDALGLPLTGKWLKDFGVGQTTVRNFLDGTSNSLTVETISKLAPALKTSEHWLLFGRDTGPVPNEDELAAMIQIAMKELPLGVSFADYPRAVSASLHAQLVQYQAAGGSRPDVDAAPSLDTTAPPQWPTRRSDEGESHNP